MCNNTNKEVNLNKPFKWGRKRVLGKLRTRGTAAEAGSPSLTTDTTGEPEAPAGHPLGARLPPLLELHHRPTPDLGALKSRVALSPPDLVFFPGLVFVDF